MGRQAEHRFESLPGALPLTGIPFLFRTIPQAGRLLLSCAFFPFVTLRRCVRLRDENPEGHPDARKGLNGHLPNDPVRFLALFEKDRRQIHRAAVYLPLRGPTDVPPEKRLQPLHRLRAEGIPLLQAASRKMHRALLQLIQLLEKWLIGISLFLMIHKMFSSE